MEPTYVAALARLDETWAEYRRTRDIEALKRRAFAACAFAITSVHTPVEQGEAEFAHYMTHAALPEGAMLPEHKTRALASLVEWIDTTTVDTFDVDGWTLADTILRNVWGLGTAKSAFAAALCGNREPYCIDTHGAQLIADRDYYRHNRWGGECPKGCAHGDPDRIRNTIKADKTRPASIARAWARYRAWGDTTFANRDHQWDFFALLVPAFTNGGHAEFFTEVFS